MLTLSVLTILASVATVVLALTISEDGHYDTRYNHLDIERILNNKRLVTYYGQCLTGDGPCTPQGTEFKRILPEALRTNCARCTEKQKTTAYHAIRRLKKEYPKIWQELQASWDPTGEYVSTFINTVESKNGNNKPVTPGAERPADNEITKEAPGGPLPRGIPKSEASTAVVTRVAATQKSAPTTENYRTSFRPTSDLLNNRATQTTTKRPATISTIQKIPTRTSPSTQSFVSTTTKDTAAQPSSLVIDLLNNNQETRTTTTTSSGTKNEPLPLIFSRGGPDPDASTTDSNYRTSNRPTSGVNNQGTQTTTTIRPTTQTQNIPRVIPSSARPVIPTQDTDTNYRISYRPTSDANNQGTQTTTTIRPTTQNIPRVTLSSARPIIPTQDTDTYYIISYMPISAVNNQGTQTTAPVKPTTQNIPRVTPSSARPIATQDTDSNYRISYRPTRFNILLPRPQDIGRLTANVIGSIGDLGNKVIRTGARIADMVLTGVQAGVQATIGRGRIQQQT